MATDVVKLILGGGRGALGREIGGWRSIRIRKPELSTYVIGAHGTGKSTLLLNLILSDIKKADKGLVVLDPHGELARAVLLRCPPDQADRVVYFAPAEQSEAPFGLNPFEWHDPAEYDLKVGAVMTVFTHLWYGDFRSTPTMQNTLETLVRTLLAAYEEHQTHFLHMLLLLRDDQVGEQWRRQLSAWVMDNPAVATKWAEWENKTARKRDTLSSKDKINHILSSPIIQGILCQPTSSDCFHLQQTLGAKKVLLVNLERLDEESQRLIGSLILTQILAMAYLRADEEARVPCHIYADEFHKFAPAAFVEIINQARKFKVFCTLAHQTLAQLDDEAKAAAQNCGNLVVFRVNPSDARILAPNFVNDQTFPKNGLSQLPLYEAMVKVAFQTMSQQAHIQTFREQGEENQLVAALIRQRSSAYGRSRAEVEDSIANVVPPRDKKPKEPLFWVKEE